MTPKPLFPPDIAYYVIFCITKPPYFRPTVTFTITTIPSGMSNRALVHPDTIENNVADASPEVSSKAIDVIWDDDKIDKVSY